MASTTLAAAARVVPGARALRALALVPGSPRDAAVIDLGSNSFRLVTFRYTPGGWWCRTGQLQEPVRVATGLAATGRLSSDAIERGVQTVAMFARYCEARGIGPGEIEAVATSAVRDAANGDELMSAARAATGLPIRVLSAEAEARCGYLAAINSTTLRDGVVLDLGGGSLQLVAVREREARELESWPLGAVRVTERMLPANRPVARKELKRARAALRAELAVATWLREAGRRLVAVGGSARNLAAAVQREHALDAAGLQGFVMGAGELRSLVERLAKLPAHARALPGIKPARADIILGAAMVLEAVLDVGGFDGMEVTRAGLRHGLFFETRLLAGGEPLIADVRQAAVRNLAIQHGAELDRVERVARQALRLHASLAESGIIKKGADEVELLHAAAMLHEVGMAVGYAGHHEHSQYLILSAGLPGFGPREVALIARMVCCHRKGVPDLDALHPLARAGDRDLVRRGALIIRLATLLEGAHADRLADPRFVGDGKAARLVLSGDAGLARWSIERQIDSDAFRRVFGRRLVIDDQG